MSLFVQNAWAHTYSVWFKSQVPAIIGPILIWRVHPTNETYNNLPKDYKPTDLQLSVPHSAVIDWIPYSSLRDRIIMFYNSSAALDRLLCDMLNSYVIEVSDLAQILPHAPRGRAYFGVWNIYSAIDVATASLQKSPQTSRVDTDLLESRSDSHESNTDDIDTYSHLFFSSFSPTSSTTEPELEDRTSVSQESSKPFNLVEILTTPASVLKLSYDIHLYATKSWRFDRALFEKWPELKFDGYEDIVAKGRSCRIPTAPPDGPVQLTESTMEFYQRAIRGLS